MDINPDMPADDLQAAIRDAQAALQLGGATILPRDPIRLVLAGLSAVLTVFGRSITRWERAVQDVIEARDPVSNDDKLALITAVEDGAFRGMRKEAQRMLRTFDRALAVKTGLTVGGAFVAGAVVMFGVMMWWSPRADISGMTCFDASDGARVCQIIVTPPRQNAAPVRGGHA